MKKFCLMVLSLLCTSSVWCQQYPSAPVSAVANSEVFAGYSFLHTDYASPLQIANGAVASYSRSFTSRLGLSIQGNAEFGKNGLRNYGAVLGPRINFGHGRYQPFAHLMVGFLQSKANFSGASVSKSSFATEIGGGVNLNRATSPLGWRIVQIDWERQYGALLSSNSADHFRIATGLNYRF